jgi:hypothetical protein
MVHPRDPGEPGDLGGAGALDELGHGQPHLRQKELELEHGGQRTRPDLRARNDAAVSKHLG